MKRIPIVALGVLAAFFGGVRFSRLGDLALISKLIESGLWAALVFVVGAIIVKVAELFIFSGEVESGGRNLGREINAFRPEDLAMIETEIPEIERPEVVGVMGKPPEELAQALRKLTEEE